MIQRKSYVRTILLLMVAGLFSGCASNEVGKSATVVGGSALGAVIANQASDGDAAWTTGGAAIGAVAALGANAMAEENERIAYRNGYEAALNQSVKQQYWIIQNRQKEDEFSEPEEPGTFVPVVLPAQEINGVIQDERVIYVKAK
jgi:hypothetical protein